jgi:hypothetical protein
MYDTTPVDDDVTSLNAVAHDALKQAISHGIINSRA